MSGVSFDVFCSHVDRLCKCGVLKKSVGFGYKKTFRDWLIEAHLGYTKDRATYVKSILDGKEYCLTNGKFKEHLTRQGTDEIGYLQKCGICLPIGYVWKVGVHGKDMKQHLFEMEDGASLYFSYRSVMTSVTSDFKKLMLLYGITEAEARSISDRQHIRRSERVLGKKNNSYGKRGLDANCFRPFLGGNPREEYSLHLRERNKFLILRWASDNDIDETSFENLKFLYYSSVFTRLHQRKGDEYKNILGLETVEQGVFLFNREKSLQCYNPKNSIEYCSGLVRDLGNDEDRENFERFLDAGEYDKIVSLCYALRGLTGWKRRVVYHSTRFGDFSLRSKLEKGFAYLVDRIGSVVSLRYENIHIPYFDGTKNKTYYVDFEVVMDDGRKVLVEVKPYSQCVIPEGDVLYKKEAAETYAGKNGYVYAFFTEKDMRYEYIRKKLQSL
jgi:hypothetical protein